MSEMRVKLGIHKLRKLRDEIDKAGGRMKASQARRMGLDPDALGVGHLKKNNGDVHLPDIIKHIQDHPTHPVVIGESEWGEPTDDRSVENVTWDDLHYHDFYGSFVGDITGTDAFDEYVEEQVEGIPPRKRQDALIDTRAWVYDNPEEFYSWAEGRSYSPSDVFPKADLLKFSEESFNGWREDQQHSKEQSQVLQVSTHPETLKQIDDAGLSDVYKAAHSNYSSAFHPGSGDNELGWVRYTKGSDGNYQIDEMQSDVVSGIDKEIKKYKKEGGHETVDKLNQIKNLLTGGQHHSQVLLDSFHEFARQNGDHESKVHSHDPAFKSKLSGHDVSGHFDEAWNKPKLADGQGRAKLAPHMRTTYGDTPKKSGYVRDGKYGDLETQTTEDYQGAPQMTETIRKKRSDLRSMAKSIRNKNLLKSDDSDFKRRLHSHSSGNSEAKRTGTTPELHVSHNSHKLRKLRDTIEQAGGKLKNSQLRGMKMDPKGLGVDHLQDAKGFISSDDVKAHIDSMPKRKYSFSFNTWGDRHEDGGALNGDSDAGEMYDALVAAGKIPSEFLNSYAIDSYIDSQLDNMLYEDNTVREFLDYYLGEDDADKTVKNLGLSDEFLESNDVQSLPQDVLDDARDRYHDSLVDDEDLPNQVLDLYVDSGATASNIFDENAFDVVGSHPYEDANTQMHSDEPSKVFQLNLHPETLQELKDQGLLGHYEVFDSRYNDPESHPNGKNGIGWVRYTEGDDGHIHIDEVQSDIGQGMSKTISRMKRGQKEGIREGDNLENYQRVHDILFGGNTASQVLQDAFLENMRQAGRHESKVHLWGAPQKANISGMDIEGHMDEYGKSTKSLKFNKLPKEEQDKIRSKNNNALKYFLSENPNMDDHATMGNKIAFANELKARGIVDDDLNFLPGKDFDAHYSIARDIPNLASAGHVRQLVDKHVNNKLGQGKRYYQTDYNDDYHEVDKKLPQHITDTYNKQPQKMGFEPSTYGELGTQDNDEYDGHETWAETVRKKRKNGHSMRKSLKTMAKIANLRKSGDRDELIRALHNHETHDEAAEILGELPEIDVAHNSHKLRIVRDLIEKNGGRMRNRDLASAGYHPKDLGLDHLQDAKGHIASSDVAAMIDSMPRSKYTFSFGDYEGGAHWGDPRDWDWQDFEKFKQLGLEPNQDVVQELAEEYEDDDVHTDADAREDYAEHHGLTPYDLYGNALNDLLGGGQEDFHNTQRHSDELSKVFQLNIHPETLQELEDAGLSDQFELLASSGQGSGHPVGDNGIGWVRYTEGDDGHIHMDEIQSNLGEKLVRHVEKMHQENPNLPPVFKQINGDSVRQMNDIIFKGVDPSQAVHDAFLENLRRAGKHDSEVELWGPKSKAKISSMKVDQLVNPDLTEKEHLSHKQLTDDERAMVGDAPSRKTKYLRGDDGSVSQVTQKLPAHMTDTYGKQPKKMGYKPSTYGSISTQDNSDYQGGVTQRETVRKKLKNPQSMRKSLRSLVKAIKERNDV